MNNEARLAQLRSYSWSFLVNLAGGYYRELQVRGIDADTAKFIMPALEALHMKKRAVTAEDVLRLWCACERLPL
jgi:hypothetical protein